MRGGLTRLSLLMAALFGLATTMAGPAAATTTPAQVPLDLAAIALTPAEFEAAGLEDYGTDYGWLWTPDEAVIGLGIEYETPVEEIAAMLVEEAGLTRQYTLRTGQPVERGDPLTVATRVVFTSIFEFPNAEGAIAGGDYLAGITVPDGAEEVEARHEFGDASHIFRSTMSDPEFDVPVEGVLLTVRTDELYVELDLQDIVWPGETAEPPTVAQAAALGEHLEARIAAVRAGELPDLGSRAVRIGTQGEVYFEADRYEVQNGQRLRHFNHAAYRYDYEQHLIDQGGVIDRYVVHQQVVGEDYDWSTAPAMMLKIDRLAGESEAKSWLARGAGRTVTWTSLREIKPVDRVVRLGDEAAAYTITVDHGSGPLTGHELFVRDGVYVVEVRVFAPDGVSLETAIALAEIQLDCLHGSNCPERVPVPAELRAT